MKTGFLPVAMLDNAGAAGSSVEDTATSSDKQAPAAAFDAVLAAVAAQVATMSAANKPAPSPVAQLTQPQTSGDVAKDLTRATANTTPNAADWLTGAGSIQLASFAAGPVDVVPGVPFQQLVTQGEPAVPAANATPPVEPVIEAAIAGVQVPAQPANPATGKLPEVPVVTQPSLAQPVAPGLANKPAANDARADSQPAVNRPAGPQNVSSTASAQAAVSASGDAPKQAQAQADLAPRQSVVGAAPATTEQAEKPSADGPARLRAEPSASDAADDKNAAQAAPQQPLQADARLLSPTNQGLASPVQVAPSVMNAETTTASKQSGGTASGRSRAASQPGAEVAAQDDVATGGFMGMSPRVAEPRQVVSPSVVSPSVVSPSVVSPSVVSPSVVSPTVVAQAEATQQSLTVQSSPAQSASAQAVVADAALPASAAAQPAAAAQVVPEASLDARVRVEFVELPALDENGNESSAQGELSPREIASELDAAHQSDERGDAQPESSAQQQNSPEQRAALPVPFQSSEVQGARGLEQVVASLLRMGSNDNSVSQAAPINQNTHAGNVAARAAQTVVTEKSGGEKSVQLSVNADQVVREAVQRREDELSSRREQSEEKGHILMQHEAKLMPDQQIPDAAPAPLLPTPAVLPDADAAQMGKLARGEGINAANISIEHPELGAMDLLVRSENGRVEVRATAETPKAAAVLRAHESALRYGIQQAGMTFGALKVRSRGADGPDAVKTRDSIKQRRRNHEWEA